MAARWTSAVRGSSRPGAGARTSGPWMTVSGPERKMVGHTPDPHQGGGPGPPLGRTADPSSTTRARLSRCGWARWETRTGRASCRETSARSRRDVPLAGQARPGPLGAVPRPRAGRPLIRGALGAHLVGGGRRRPAESAVAWEGFLCARCAKIGFCPGPGGLRRSTGSAASRPVQPFRHSGERRERPPGHARTPGKCASGPPGRTHSSRLAH